MLLSAKHQRLRYGRTARLLMVMAIASLFSASCPFQSSADELSAEVGRPFVAEPDGYRTDDYRKPVPSTLKGGRVLNDAEANRIWASRTAVFIDVYPHAPKPANLPPKTLWRDPAHQTIEDAVWLPNVGYGGLSDEIEMYFKTRLDKLTGADKAKPIVFFCQKNCWMSWNAAKRALSYGYTNVYWYPDGTDGWQISGGMTDDVRPMP